MMRALLRYTRPQFPATRALRQLRGLHNAFVDMTELALRYLVQQAARSGLPAEAFALQIKREIRGIATIWQEPRSVLASAARSYVIQTDMIADRLFASLRDDVRKFKQPAKWVESDGSKRFDSLRQLLANMPAAQSASITSSPDFAIVNYYRLVRNDIVHGKATKQRSRDAHGELLAEHGQGIRELYPGFHAPNILDELAFDDHRVFTRAVERLSRPLNDAFDLTAEEIVRVMVSDKTTKDALRFKRADRKRLERFVRVYCHNRHALRPKECGHVLALVDAFLAKDPTKRERRRILKRAQIGA
jgi:hypothetical protein